MTESEKERAAIVWVTPGIVIGSQRRAERLDHLKSEGREG